MIFWVALAAFLIPLIYMLSTAGSESRHQRRELERIQRRLAQKEGRTEDIDPGP